MRALFQFQNAAGKNDRAFPWILAEDKSLSFWLAVNLTGCLKGQSSSFHTACKGEQTERYLKWKAKTGDLGWLNETVLILPACTYKNCRGKEHRLIQNCSWRQVISQSYGLYSKHRLLKETSSKLWFRERVADSQMFGTSYLCAPGSWIKSAPACCYRAWLGLSSRRAGTWESMQRPHSPSLLLVLYLPRGTMAVILVGPPSRLFSKMQPRICQLVPRTRESYPPVMGASVLSHWGSPTDQPWPSIQSGRSGIRFICASINTLLSQQWPHLSVRGPRVPCLGSGQSCL